MMLKHKPQQTAVWGAVLLRLSSRVCVDFPSLKTSRTMKDSSEWSDTKLFMYFNIWSETIGGEVDSGLSSGDSVGGDVATAAVFLSADITDSSGASSFTWEDFPSHQRRLGSESFKSLEAWPPTQLISLLINHVKATSQSAFYSLTNLKAFCPNGI